MAVARVTRRHTPDPLAAAPQVQPLTWRLVDVRPFVPEPAVDGDGGPPDGDGGPPDGEDVQRSRAVAEGTSGGPAAAEGRASVAATAPSALTTAEWAKAMKVGGGIAVLGLLVGSLLLLNVGPEGAYRVGSDFSAFAALFVLALAVERLLEPLARFADTSAAKDARDEADADVSQAATAAEEKTKLAVLAQKQAAYDKARQTAAIIHWGLAVGVSAVIAGSLDALLLTAIAAPDSANPNRVVDLVVTALVVGAGTKPLHDLVSKLEKKKEQEQDPPSTGGRSRRPASG
ncbi:hypothetical protein [Blastococcus sp. TF02A-26]|uniref:hypothetical protein n=1 Tax=Blastococcus sp. TF02A-26 TaxID=2250577 RepID=UPI0011BEF095|nr:hypothetical protein [Blastococcus sp. TF02A-26]